MKKLLSFALVLTLLMSLLVSALAAVAPHDVDISQEPLADWDDGPSIVIHNVIDRCVIRWASVDEPVYDVTVGGGFTLEMPFPTANRRYNFDIYSTYMPGSDKRGGTWSGRYEDRFTITESDGKSSYSFTFTEDMVGEDQILSFYVGWLDYDGTDYLDGGDASFSVRVRPASDGEIHFTDVPAGEYFAKPVEWAIKQGIAKGTANTTFSPKNPCTVAQILTFLWRGAGRPGASGNSLSWDEELIAITEWANTNGINISDRNEQCTRSSAVYFMWKAAGSPEPKSNAAFSDVPTNSSYAKAVSWAVENGITNGVGGGKFSPNGGCDRGQIVTFVYRLEVEALA